MKYKYLYGLYDEENSIEKFGIVNTDAEVNEIKKIIDQLRENEYYSPGDLDYFLKQGKIGEVVYLDNWIHF